MPVQDDFHSLKQYLEERYCKLTDDWIRNQLSTGNDFQQIYQQWLDKDWSQIDCKLSSLDTISSDWRMNVLNIEKRTINGNYLLQVNSVLDISKPLPLGNVLEADVNENSDSDEDSDGEEDFGKLFKKGKNPQNKKTSKDKKTLFGRGPRMLQFELIDGRQNQCLAIEYEPLTAPGFNDKMIGSKLLLQGPFDLHVGVILLRPSNVKIVLEKSITAESSIASNIEQNQTEPQQQAQQRESLPYFLPDADMLVELLDDII